MSRILFALMGAAFGALLVALAEAREAASAAGLHDSVATLVWADVGVLAPLALGVGTIVAAASLLLEPGGPVAPSERLAALRAEPVLARSRTAAIAPLAFGVATAWLTIMAHTARALVAEGAPRPRVPRWG